MGQQQLLLLVLGIVIVGLAVVVGIQAFGESQDKANSDALVNDAVRIASDAQAWKLKPQAFGGGAADNFNTLTLQKLGYANDSDVVGAYSTLNGKFAHKTGGTPGEFKFQGCNATYKNSVIVTVNGSAPSNISTTVDANSTCTEGTYAE